MLYVFILSILLILFMLRNEHVFSDSYGRRNGIRATVRSKIKQPDPIELHH